MLIGMLLAGQHTSSTTSSWVGFFLAKNKHVQVGSALKIQGTHCTGKVGKMAPKKIGQGIWKCCQSTGKTQGIWFAQVVNSLILKVKDFSKFAAKISKFKSVLCM